MVTLWPWRGSDNSPAGFEKTLSTLSGKISRATARLDTHRQNARRYKALWTLYTTFAYLLYSIILALVLGWQHWGAVEYSAVAGGPVFIYIVRLSLDTYYQYRISSTVKYLDGLQKERDATIEKLKEATKYNSTLQLLEKYGGESPKRTGSPKETDSGTGGGNGGNKKRDPRMRASLPFQPGRTGIAPPPTANIRPQPGSMPTTPIRSPPMGQRGPPPPSNLNPQLQPPRQPTDEPGFAPNAFPPSQPQHADSLEPHWYDRILDVLLGEDETLPKNRLALICSQCRLVNGQAAPGIRTLEEVGRWRCGSCGAWNGQESETKRALAGIQEAAEAASTSTATNAGHNRHRSQSHPHPLSQQQPIILEPSRPSSGTDGAWEPVSARGSVSSEIGSGNFSPGEGTDASMVVAPTSSEGEFDEAEEEEYVSGVAGSGNDDDEDSGEQAEAEEEPADVDVGSKGARKRAQGGKGKAKLEPGGGIAARTRSKSPKA
ncbi:hypothetical protein FQN50_004686 [Emmonsiellopsis sp. PD_5]|nr:hypothetical protein FQN50_004686 [Emmonsiellopsis sp. PD_5]